MSRTGGANPMTLTCSLLPDSGWRLTRHRGEIGWGIVLRLGKLRVALWSVDLATRTADLLFQRETLASFLHDLGFEIHLLETDEEKILRIQEAAPGESSIQEAN
ncbi:MAG: hypothetical protein AB1405_03260 [Bdellovibrionota bacterium]